MSDELEVKDLIAHLYEGANQLRPVGISVDGSNPAAVAGALDYLMQHTRATEGALRKLGQLLDDVRHQTASTAAAIAAATESAAAATESAAAANAAIVSLRAATESATAAAVKPAAPKPEPEADEPEAEEPEDKEPAAEKSAKS